MPRPRRRDLPAAVRRRQAVAVCLLAVAAAGLALLLLRGGSAEPVPLKRLAGQVIVGRLGRGGPSAELLGRVRAGTLSGVVAFPASAARLREQSRRLRAAARAGGVPPPLIALDQEGGAVKRLPGPPDSSPRQLAGQGPAAAEREGMRTGAYLRGLGVNVELAPVVDVPGRGNPRSLAGRAFSRDPAAVAELGAAFVRGLGAAGVAATVKHFPGLGLAKQNTDAGPARVTAPRAALAAGMRPFAAAIDAGVPIVMVSTAIYAALDPARPAALSGEAVSELRDRLGFEGAIATDDLEAKSVSRDTAPPAAAAAAVAAGADLALLVSSPSASTRAYSRILAAARAGDLDRSRLEDAYERVVELKDSLPR